MTWLRNQLDVADSDLLRQMLRTFPEQLMGAGADALCGAPYGERSDERVNSRNGYRERTWVTRGTMTLASPSCASAATSPTGCCSRAGARSVPWSDTARSSLSPAARCGVTAESAP